MRILGLDTATQVTAAALWDSEAGDGGVEARDDPPPGVRPRHSTRLLPSIVELLEREAVSWEDLDRLAVGVGPGTFTGLRIGIATARALSRAQTIPLAGVSTLESLALGGARSAQGSESAAAVVAVMDARRREVFVAGWRLRSGKIGARLAERFLEPQVLAPADLAERLEAFGPRMLAVGDGSVEFRTVLERSGLSIPDDGSELHRVSALNHCRLAAGHRAGAPGEIRPEYVRLPDAEIALRAAGRK